MSPTDRKSRILRAAADLFIANGYAGVSMDDVQAKVGCSKSTLYRYFADKMDLFRSAVEMLIAERQEPIREFHPGRSDVHQALCNFGRHFATVVLDPQAIALHRLVSAESERVATIGQTFVDAGPEVGIAILGGYLDSLRADGLIDVVDVKLAAAQLFQAMLGDLQMRMLMNTGRPARREIDTSIEAAVSTFLNGVGVRESMVRPGGTRPRSRRR